MELFLKCKSIIVKKKKNNSLMSLNNNNSDINKEKMKNELLKEISDNDEEVEEVEEQEESTKASEECMKVFNDVLKLNLKFEEKKKIDLINSVLNIKNNEK
jgi:hypothetical protein